MKSELNLYGECCKAINTSRVRVMTRIVIVGLYYKSKIVGLTLDSGIEIQNSAVLSPGSGIVSQKWDVPYLPKWWSMRRRNRIFVFTR